MEANNEAISIGDFVRFALRHWVVSVVIVVVALIGSVVYVRFSPALYQATAKIIVLGDKRQQGVDLDVALSNYVALMTSVRVLNKVEAEQSDLTAETIRENMDIARDKTNEMIEIVYTSPASDRAAGVINSTIRSFQEAVTEMYWVPDDGVNILSAPIDSGEPVNKSFLMPLLISFAGGVALALAVAFLRFDASWRSASKIDESDEQEKRRQRRIAKDAENLRKQKVAADLYEVEARKAELDERKTAAEARKAETELRISEIDLKKVDAQILKAKKRLSVAEKKKETAEIRAAEAKVLAEKAELELQSAITEINIKEEKQIAMRQSLARRRAARLEARINSRTDVQIVRIRAQKRIEAERAAEVVLPPPVEPPAVSVEDNESAATHRTPNTTYSRMNIGSIVKRPLGER